MKHQTKAILASTIVLALALSSISGVTYSWFTDTQTNIIEVSTAVLNLEGTLDNNECTYELTISDVQENGNQTEEDRSNLTIIKTGTKNYEITATNDSPIPVDLKVEVLCERYQALINTAHVAEIKPKTGNQEGYEIISLGTTADFYNTIPGITFNGSELSALHDETKQDNSGGNSWTHVRHFTYWYTICDITIPPHSSTNSTIPLQIISKNGFNPNLMQDLRLESTISQSKRIVQQITNGTAEVEYDATWPKDFYFQGEGFTILVPKEALKETISPATEQQAAVIIEVKYLSVTITKSDYLVIKIIYKNGNTEITPDGTIEIWYEYNIGLDENPMMVSGSLKAPASEKEYVLYKLNAGGSS